MKRIIAIIAIAASMFSAVNASARGGIIGGFTSSSTKLNKENLAENAKAVSLYHVGLTYQMQLPAGFSIQPSILYQMKGTNLSDVGSVTDLKVETKAGYLEVPVSIQWGPDLVVARPYVFVEPFVGYRLTGTANGSIKIADLLNITDTKTITDAVMGAMPKLEYGFGIGAGVELIQHLQVSIQWFTNLGKLMDENSQVDGAKVIAAASESLKQQNFSGIKVSAAFFF